MQAAKAEVQTSRRRISAIWIVPIIAVMLGLWLAINAWLDQGPTVHVSFSTASGIEANKTRIRLLNVDIGVVTEVKISDDLSGIIVEVELDPIARQFLSDDPSLCLVEAAAAIVHGPCGNTPPFFPHTFFPGALVVAQVRVPQSREAPQITRSSQAPGKIFLYPGPRFAAEGLKITCHGISSFLDLSVSADPIFFPHFSALDFASGRAG